MNVLADARPGRPHDHVNLGSRGLLPVVVMGSRYFETSRIDPNSLRLAGAAPEKTKATWLHGEDADLNRDGFADRMLRFRSDALVVDAATERALLEGRTLDGVPFEADVVFELLGEGNGVSVSKPGPSPLADFGVGPGLSLAPQRSPLGVGELAGGLLLSLPTSGLATLELFDLAGRRLAAQRVSEGPGTYRAGLEPEERVVPGVYWVRLRQGSEEAAIRLVLVR